MENKPTTDGNAPVTTNEDMSLGGGLRLNEGKTRYDLLEPWAIEQLAKVFTKGAEKYKAHNWLRGMAWSKMRASLGRHLAAWDKGEDFDFDPNCEMCKTGTCKNHTGLYHMAQVAWNAMCLISYYKYFPQGDDRIHHILPKPKITLDLDEVVVNWVEEWCELYKIEVPSSWYFQWDIVELFKKMNESGELPKFYMGLSPKFDPKELKFEPIAYISHRPVAKQISEDWLVKHGFPLKPVHHVENRADKVKIAKDLGADIHVDDSYETFLAMNAAGICCYLMDAKHNQKYDVGYRRIKSLSELPV